MIATAPRRASSRRWLAAALFATAVLGTAACNNNQGQATQNNSNSSERSSSSGSGSGGAAHVDKNSYPIPQAVPTLKLDNRAGAVTVTAGDGPISVTETLKYSDDKPTTSHDVQGDTLSLVNSGCPNQSPVNGHCEVDWDIHAPAGTTLDLGNKAGKITVTGMSGTVSAETSSGGVDGHDLASKSVTAKTRAGGVDLTFVAVPDQVGATSNAGGIDIALPGGTSYAVQADSNTGDPDITVPQDSSSPHRIQARTNAGSIDISTR